MEEGLALHHSAIDRSEREAIEASVKAGSIRWVVCTSSLDLGVDFQPVETGGADREAPRIWHGCCSGQAGQRTCPAEHPRCCSCPPMPLNCSNSVPCGGGWRRVWWNNASRRKPLLMFCCSTSRGLACGPGFNPEHTLQTVRSCAAYADLSQDEWDWCMLFLKQGGECLGAYPRYRKLEWEETSQRYRVREQAIARLHPSQRRNNHGRTGDHGAVCAWVPFSAMWRRPSSASSSRRMCSSSRRRQLEFVRLRDMTAYVKVSTKKTRTVPAWGRGTDGPLRSADPSPASRGGPCQPG